MFELIALLLECRSSGTLPAPLTQRVDIVVRDALRGFDALQAYQLEQEFLSETRQ
jgi:hypothetical protein